MKPEPVETPVVFPLRYGADDSLGAANEITEEKVREAAALVRQGRRYSLGQVLDDRSPTQMWRYWKHSLLVDRVVPGRFLGPNRQSFVEEAVAGALHSGTHLDALGHIGIGELAYNGARYADIVGPTGLARLGIEGVPPLFTRGVLLDVAAARGVAMLDTPYVVGPEDLERAERRTGVRVGPGDAVLIHTGWGALWDADGARYAAGEPGIGLDAARWLTDRRVAVVGSDNWAVEAVPSPPDMFPVHQHLITLYGVYLLENARTLELARDGVTAFCFAALAARLRGASASPVAPAAIV
jgi:kynurenine formamidase